MSPGDNDKSALLVGAAQTDAAVNPGNSGGALVNCEGQLVGVPTAGASGPSSSGWVPEGGLFVQAVSAGGPAAAAGLRPHDVITKVDGQPATSNVQLPELTLTRNPGDTVPIVHEKNGHSTQATVTLIAQPRPGHGPVRADHRSPPAKEARPATRCNAGAI